MTQKYVIIPTGEIGFVYMGNIDYPKEAYKIGELTSQMKNNKHIHSFDSWYDKFVVYVDQAENIGNYLINFSYSIFYLKNIL